MKIKLVSTMMTKEKNAFYGAGLSLIIGYILKNTYLAILASVHTYIVYETTMSYGDYYKLTFLTGMVIQTITFLCVCIFLAIAFKSIAENNPQENLAQPAYILSIVSAVLLIAAFIPDVVLYNNLFYYPLDDPIMLSAIICRFLFWFVFCILIIQSARILNRAVDNYQIKSLRLAFFVGFGLSVFRIFMDHLGYYIDYEIESFTAFYTFFSVLSITEIIFAVLTGLLFVLYSFKKIEDLPVKNRINEHSQS